MCCFLWFLYYYYSSYLIEGRWMGIICLIESWNFYKHYKRLEVYFADFGVWGWELVWQHVDEWAEDNWPRTRMGFYAEGYHKAEEYSRRVARASVQLRGLYDAIYVSTTELFWSFTCLFLEIIIMFHCNLSEVIVDMFLELYSLSNITWPSTICVLKILLMIIHNSCMTNTGSLLRSTLFRQWVTLLVVYFTVNC